MTMYRKHSNPRKVDMEFETTLKGDREGERENFTINKYM